MSATSSTDDYEREVTARVARALAEGCRSFADVCRRAEGADLRLVHSIFEKQIATLTDGTSLTGSRVGTTYRSRSLPAADPLLSQWWFRDRTTSSLSNLAHELLTSSGDATPVVFLGTPAAALHYAHRFGNAILLDADPDLLKTMDVKDGPLVNHYHTNDPLPPCLAGSCGVVVLDPPWYFDQLKAFLVRGLQLLAPNGHLLCTFPPRLLRPEVMDERETLLQWLSELRVAIVSLVPGVVDYDVPSYEAAAFCDLKHFNEMPWRVGDLLQARRGDRVPEDSDAPVLPALCVERFSRKAATFRVFLRSDAVDVPLGEYIKTNAAFARSVSRRQYNVDDLSIWTSENAGGQLQDVASTRLALSLWAAGKDPKDTTTRLTEQGLTTAQASNLVNALTVHLGVWSRDPDVTQRRTEDDQRRIRLDSLSDWAAKASGRPYPAQSDDFRLEFPRDRDRVLWSNGLRRLANKTQVFPAAHDDNLRQRLAHSVEVKQLAATIGDNFGLDPDLIEAGALAHDIGHTPFGHAGEHAIDKLLDDVAKGIGGFNHYEHGVDVVRWLEDAYMASSSGGFPGLNLTPEVAECIFKHTYCQTTDRVSQYELWKRSKHQGKYIDNRMCHLEGQAVRLADKVSYLISDLEDGIRLGVFTTEQLLVCRLFNRPGIDIVPRPNESLLRRFLAQRRNLLALIMEDAIDATNLRLSKLGSSDKVREAPTYTVDHSAALKADVNQIWAELQVQRLHRDPRVVMANMRAAKIVGELLVLFALAPDLIESEFAAHHERLWKGAYLDFYRTKGGPMVDLHSHASFLPIDMIIGMGIPDRDHPTVPMERLVMAKDYVASLTDGMATALHTKHLSFG